MDPFRNPPSGAKITYVNSARDITFNTGSIHIGGQHFYADSNGNFPNSSFRSNRSVLTDIKKIDEIIKHLPDNIGFADINHCTVKKKLTAYHDVRIYGNSVAEKTVQSLEQTVFGTDTFFKFVWINRH